MNEPGERRRLLVVGAGGHGKVVADAAMSTAVWSTIAFVDDRAAELSSVIGLPVLGAVADLERLRGSFEAVVLAVGKGSTRLALALQCEALGFELPSIVHRSASVSPFATLGRGCAVLAQAAVNPGAALGVACIVNTGATVDHDCQIADGVHICPGAHLAGNVYVAERAWIGIGASIRQGVRIGKDATIGAGAVVVCDIADGSTAVGVPARQRRAE